MGFKLVRVDSQDPCKVPLQIGTHIIGRGKFLDCDDKRVSRNHGELVVSDDSITIKALHRNPLFYIKKAVQVETEILAQSCTMELYNGDKFGLLPDIYWYELIYCINKEPNNTMPIQPVMSEQNKVIDTTVKTDESSPQSPSLLSQVPEPEHATQNLEVDEAPNPSKESPTQDSQSTVPADVPSKTLNQQETEPYTLKRQQSLLSDGDSSDEVKKIKVEPDIKEEPKEIKSEPNEIQGGPSDVQGGGNDDLDAPNSDQAGPSCKPAADTSAVDDKAGSPPSPAKPPAQPPAPRERCLYGANCYRRNPQHKMQFSHPADSDWGAGPLGNCPWGSRCRRQDPRHWTQHVHPPGTVPPQQRNNGPQAGKRRKEKKKRHSSDEDSPVDDLIVTGKRVRKTIARPEYSDSESDSDPYKTDGSDEWQPSGNTDSQIYSQDD